jgi:hypothetical protein
MPLLQRESVQKSETRHSQESESTMILTTSRRAGVRCRWLCRELQSVIPLSCYVLRGKKGIRELIPLSVEKGAERMIIVGSKGGNPTALLFYAEWELLGELSIAVTLRRELNIPKIPPLQEDVPFLLQSSEKDAERIAHLFGAELYRGNDAYTYMMYKKGCIDFYRLDITEYPVGPRLQVNCIT